ncbi:MAG: TlpA family protein disulfide reductase [Kofleriaceae bacterium]
MVHGSVGLPAFAALRVTLPVLHVAGDTALGSASAELAMAAKLAPHRSFTLNVVGAIGGVLGSEWPAPVVFGDLQIASPGIGVRAASMVQLTHRIGTSLSLTVADEPDFYRFGAQLGQALLDGQLAIGAGASSSFSDDGPPALASSFVTFRPRSQPDLAASLFGAISLESRAMDGFVAGLAVTWEVGSGHPGRRLLGTSVEETENIAELTPRPEATTAADYVVTGVPTVFVFEAWWCTPCRDLDREVRRAAREHPEIRVIIADADDHGDLLISSGGRGVPYAIVFDSTGAEVGKLNGYKPGELDALLIKALR